MADNVKTMPNELGLMPHAELGYYEYKDKCDVNGHATVLLQYIIRPLAPCDCCQVPSAVRINLIVIERRKYELRFISAIFPEIKLLNFVRALFPFAAIHFPL